MIPVASDARPLLTFRRGRRYAPSSHAYAHGAVVAVLGDRLKVTTELCSVDLIYWLREGDRILLSPDLRALYRRGMSPDPRGILSLLILGMPFPPFTLLREIGAFQPGTETTIDLTDLSMRARSAVTWSERSKDDESLSEQAQVETFVATLDAAIEEVLTDETPFVLFSGGVDSSVLAWRLRELGRRDAHLVHLTSGPDSPETRAAHAMRKLLGLPMDLVSYRRGGAAEHLERAPFVYRQPFADPSAVPAATLMRAAVELAHRDSVILNGAGADGAFGLVRRSRRYRALDLAMPSLLRAAFGWPYRRWSLWRETGPFATASGLAHRLHAMPGLLGAVAANPMFRIAHTCDEHVWAALNRELDDWVDRVRPQDDRLAAMPLLHLAVLRAGVSAQREFWFAAEAGVRLSFPYLRRSIVDLGVRRAAYWRGSERPKHALYGALARCIGERPAREAPTRGGDSRFGMFREAAILERLDALTASDARIADFVDPKTFFTAVNDLKQGRTYQPAIYEFLWGALIAESWLSKLGEAAEELRSGLRDAGENSFEEPRLS